MIVFIYKVEHILGWGAGITEMLLQSHAGLLQLLPAVAPSWKNGNVKGLRARGGFTVDMKWKTGRLKRAVVFSKTGGHCKVRYKDILTEIYVPTGGAVALDGKLRQISK
jgi:alpha-L-fucosidase 2